MGRRSEPRIAISFPVVVHGFDLNRNPFAVNAETFDISLCGASVKGVNAVTKPGAKIEIEYGDQKAWFCVQWVGKSGSSKAGRIGVRCLEHGKYIWGVPSKSPEPDTYEPPSPEGAVRTPAAVAAYSSPSGVYAGQERRKFARHTCRIQTQVIPDDTSIGLPGTITDVSLGGCYVEMLSPLPVDSVIHLSLNPGSTTLHMSGKVRSSQMGLGMGVAFTGMGPEDFEKLWRFAPPGATSTSERGSQPAKALPVRLPELPARVSPPNLELRTFSDSDGDSLDLRATSETLEAVVQLLLDKGYFTCAEIAEEIEKRKSTKA
jgi:hypothetical protein